MVGYHGESSRSRSQRHSASCFSATQVGRASAPARWATEVSQVTTRSSARHRRRRVDEARRARRRSRRRASRPACRPADRRAARRRSPSAARSAGRRESRRAARRRRAEPSAPCRLPGLGLPCQTMPILKPAAPMRARPSARPLGLGGEIGDRGRHAVEPGGEGARQAADAICASKRSPGVALRDQANPSERRHQPVQPRRAQEGRLGAGAGHQRQVAAELDRVAEAVIVHHQHALAGAAGAAPSRESARRAPRRATCRRASALRSPPSRARNRRASDRGSRAPLIASRLPSASPPSKAARASSRRPSARRASAWPLNASP